MDTFYQLILLCGFLIPLSWGLYSQQRNLTSPSKNSTLGNVTESSISNNSAQNSSGNITPTNSNLENSTIHNSTDSTTSTLESSSTGRSPTAQTKITTVQTTPSSTDNTPTSVATQSTSERASVRTASTTSSPEVTVHWNSESTYSTTIAHFITETAHGNKTNNETTGAGLNLSEKSITILFSVVLGVIVLLVLGQIVYKVSRNKHRTIQYSHQPLHNEDTGEQFMVPDDTLVISGGLYDGPQIYNPTVTILNDEDHPTFAYTSTQLRLEFLREEHGTHQDFEATSFETFKTTDDKT